MNISAQTIGLLLLAAAALSCSSGGETPPPGGQGSSGDAGTSSGSSGSSSGSSGTSGAVTGIDGIPAGDPAAFNAWLQKKEYQAWPKESASRAFTTGAGGHSGTVRAYLNPTLDASMKAGNAVHPMGSAAVKEFLQGESLTGWAAYVKTQDKSGGGAGWYWYEVFSVTPGASSIGGQGSATCTGCHSTGKDFVRVPYPLK